MKNTQITGNIGLYYVCYRLSRLGWNALPTARNARGVDILAYNRDCSRVISLQVKTLSTRTSVLLGRKPEFLGDYWVIVNDVNKGPKVYVLTPDEVKENTKQSKKEGLVTFWLPLKSYEIDKFKEAWGKIGEADRG